MVTSLNPDFLRDACAAIKLVTGEEAPALAFVGNCWVWSNRQICTVVMPRMTENAKGWTGKPLEPLAA